MSQVGGRWAARKGQGAFVPRAELTAQQQAVLAAVPHWKREWVRPAALKPGQRPGYKVLKWVIDDSASAQVGTEEEMQAAMQVVAAGEVAQLPGQATPAGLSTEVSTPAPATGSGTATPAVAESDLVPVNAADKPAEGPAPDGSNPSVLDSVKALQTAPQEGLISEDVEMSAPKPFVEDEVQVAQEATEGMVGMTVPEVVEGTA